MRNNRLCILHCLAILAVLAFLAFIVPARASDMCETAFGRRVEGAQTKNDEDTQTRNAEPATPREIVDIIPKSVELKAVRFERDTLPSEVTSEKDPRFKKGLINLLKMVTDTVFVNSKKEAQKGELHLAKMLGNGQSLEFYYVRDERGGETVFRLSKIVLVKPNGQEITIDKSPVTDEGEFLQKKSVVLMEKTVQRDDGVTKQIQTLDKEALESWLKDLPELKDAMKLGNKGIDVVEALQQGLPKLAEGDRQKTSAMLEKSDVVQVPVVIKGPLLTRLISWLDRVPFLSRQEMRASLEKDSTSRLIWKARSRYGLKLMVDVTRKQASKFILLGSVFLAYSQVDAITSYFHKTDVRPIANVEEIVRMSPLQEPERQVMADVLTKFSGQPSYDAGLLGRLDVRAKSASLPRDVVADYARYEKLVGDLLAVEPNATFYLGDAGFKKIETFNSFHAGREAARTADAGYMIAQFPAQKKILITSILHEGKAGLPVVSTLVVDQTVDPITYQSIGQTLEKISAAGVPVQK